MRTISVCRREFSEWPVLVLLICLVSCPGGGGTTLATDEAGVLPAGRRFHARFVVDRVRPPPSPLNQANNQGEGPPIPAANTPTARRCRQGCLQKRSIKDILCTQQRDCSMCWDVCNRNNQVRREHELSHRLLLSLGRMIRNESVVTADIEWTTPAELVRHQPPGVSRSPPPSPSVSSGSDDVERLSRIARDGSVAPSLPTGSDRTAEQQQQQQQQQYHQCLVSWEISGGGLTGNLLTETFMVELSLWPNTKYYVHVTCRNKVTDSLIRSASLLVDTSEAVIVSLHGTSSTTTTPTTTPMTTTVASPEVTALPPSESWAPHRRPTNVDLPNPATRILWAFGEEDDGDEVQAVAAPSTGTSKEILILGAFVALLVLLLLSLTVVLVVRRKPSAPEDREELLIESRQHCRRPPVMATPDLPPKIILHV
ncbi:uncharacterized protein LOC126580886 [Anopheles aquasalis]|uniref:uncharacterized protein LOC126580886 n=1 Tax=Anopheles aquasalis TaxID=42839 RepID=UPI00215B062E|nr:uncharacterized protein LOC126580886 [Anopheles aquasalis]